MKDQYKEVDEALDTLIDDDYWSYPEDTRSMIFTTKKIKDLFHSELEKVRQETEKRHQREMKKINDIVVGAFLEIAGTVWGIDAPDRKWTDRQMTYFNVKVAEIRDKCLDQISQSIKEISK